MIFSYRDYLRYLYEQLDTEPRKVYISTYNLNAGISPRGGIYTGSDTFRLLSFLNAETKGSKILVGLPPEPTAHRRLTNCAEYFRNIDWRFRTDNHLKCWLFFNGNKLSSITGGRNLGDSEWPDVSVPLNGLQSRQLLTFYDSLWLTAKRLQLGTFKLKA